MLGLRASASRLARRYGPRTRAGLIRSIFRQSRSAKANLARWACHGCPSLLVGAWQHVVDLISITDQVVRSLIPRECLRDLACDPVRGRMGCDVDRDKV